jgi:SAM-dependent methyltransferase
VTEFRLRHFDPVPLGARGQLDGGATSDQGLIALDIQSKYLFVDERGKTFHEYFVPGTPDVQNCGGYVDKVIKYRDPDLAAHIRKNGVSSTTFANSPFPILATRSPRLDLLLHALILDLKSSRGADRVSLLDHGCTVAEHYDLLDIMLRAETHDATTASSALAYCGLDKSAMLLSIAKMLHHQVPEEHFSLVHSEGSSFPFSRKQFDLSLSVGVVNHTAEPVRALESILAATRHASVLALWVTAGKEGFWAINHSSVPQYFFSLGDLREALERRGEGRFYSTEFVLETEASQLRSYVGLGEGKLKTLGSYHLVFSTLPALPFPAEELLL